MKRFVLVLGMHRSGTSMLAAGLSALGLKLGDFDDAPDDDNPKGYFEHPKVRDFNERLFAHLGASWDNWAFYAPEAGLEGGQFDTLRDAAIALVNECFPEETTYVLKDPRISSLLPFWESVFRKAGWAVDRILILRNPVEVAESQRQRAERRPNAFRFIAAAEPMHALWATTMHGLLASLPDDRTFLIEHRSLVSGPAKTISACAAFLRLAVPSLQLTEYAKNFVDPKFHRARDQSVTTPGKWELISTALHRDLTEMAMPRILGTAEAKQIADRQADFLAQLPGFEVVRLTLGQAVKWGTNR